MTIQTMRDFGIGEGQIYVGGRWVDSASRERREIENPKDESVVAAVASSTTEDADRAVAAARKAQPEWSRLTPMERGALLQKLANLIDENSETLAALLTAEGGKLLSESRIDANFAALLLRYAAESARRLQGEILPGEGRDEQICSARALWGRRRHHRLELPSCAVCPQGRPRAGDGQHHRRQAARADAVDHAGARRTQPARRHT
jgi:lactaldehyde dehydrogenase/glycolaldehyde dehydrogenase